MLTAETTKPACLPQDQFQALSYTRPVSGPVLHKTSFRPCLPQDQFQAPGREEQG